MKIAIYVPFWPPGKVSNGIVTYASYLVPALRRLGHTVYVLARSKADEDDDPYTLDLRKYVPPRSLWHRALYKIDPATAGFKSESFLIASAIKELVEKHKLDVCEIEESGGWNFAVSHLNSVPVVVRLHGPWFLTGRFNAAENESPLFRRREKLEGRGIRNAQLVIASCEQTLEAVKRHYGFQLGGSRIIPIPIAAAAENRTWSVDASARDSILFIGRFDRLKGGDLVLKAFSELAASNKKLSLTFVGPDKGIRQDDGRIYRFDDFVRQNLSESTRSQIQFRGELNRAEIMSLRTTHFVTIAASQFETMGYAILEAMSVGCPLVTTDVGGIPEFIDHCRNGLIVPSQNVNAMAAACRELLNNRDLAARLGRQAWEDCRRLYAPDNIAKQTVEPMRKRLVDSKVNVRIDHVAPRLSRLIGVALTVFDRRATILKASALPRRAPVKSIAHGSVPEFGNRSNILNVNRSVSAAISIPSWADCANLSADAARNTGNVRSPNKPINPTKPYCPMVMTQAPSVVLASPPEPP